MSGLDMKEWFGFVFNNGRWCGSAMPRRNSLEAPVVQPAEEYHPNVTWKHDGETKKDPAGCIYAAEKATQIALIYPMSWRNGYINDYPTGRLLLTQNTDGRARRN